MPAKAETDIIPAEIKRISIVNISAIQHSKTAIANNKNNKRKSIS